jgi:hypothetical protein
MATRSRIGIELSDHTVVSAYCHWDGYPEHNGKILVKHYQNREDVQNLINGGSMSCLRTRTTWTSGNMLLDEKGDCVIDSQNNIMYENDREPQPLYHSERGDGVEPSHTTFKEFVGSDCGEEYAYLYDLDGKWQAYKTSWSEQKHRKVKIPA